MFKKLKEKIGGLYKNNLSRPFMYALTAFAGVVAVGGAFWVAGWAVGEISGLVSGLRNLHLPAKYTTLITTAVFWKVAGIVAAFAFAVGVVVSVFSFIVSKAKSHNKAKIKSKYKGKSKCISRGKEKQLSQEYTKGYKYEKKLNNFFNKKNKIENSKPNITKNNYVYKKLKTINDKNC